MKFCSKCGAEMQDNDVFCNACGSSTAADPAAQQPQPQPEQTAAQKSFNVFGLVGMIAGILAIILVWAVTWVGIALAIVGIVFSAIGMAKRKDCRTPGFAIAGLVCSIVALVVVIIALVIVIAALAAIA